MNKRKIGVSVALVATVVAAFAMTATGKGGAPRYQDAEIVAAGMAIYAENCAACHGEDLAGEPNWQDRDADGYLPAPPHDETGHTWHHPTAQLFEITKFGTEALVGNGYKSRMAGYGGILSDDEILAVLAYIKSTWPARIIERHDQMDAAVN